MSMIQIQKVSKFFPGGKSKNLLVLDQVSLDVPEGEFLVLIGPSGCGKSTLLRIMAGLAEPSLGKVTIAGRDVDGPAVGVGMVFQTYTSFPWLTVEQNVAFGLSLKGTDRIKNSEKVRKIVDRVGLSKFLAAFPSQLSGGMQQRVAIARALATDPKVLLMDEPFGALDAMIRVEMQAFLIDLWQQERKTVVFVTHDIDEAILLGDRIVVLSPHPGRIHEVLNVKIARPRSIQDTETSDFVALRHALRTMIFAMGEANNALTRPEQVSDCLP